MTKQSKQETLDSAAAVAAAAQIVSDAAKAAAKAVSDTAVAAAATAATASAIVGLDISYIKKDISDIKNTLQGLSGEYVTREEFDPIKKTVYGVIGLLGVSMIGALLKLVLVK